MARRDTAPRRYAEAAFEVAMRDDTVEQWRAYYLDGAKRRLCATQSTLNGGSSH